jgi:hypothetical protein
MLNSRMYRRKDIRICDKVESHKKKGLSVSLNMTAWGASQQAEKWVRGGKLESAPGNLPNPFSHPEKNSTSKITGWVWSA